MFKKGLRNLTILFLSLVLILTLTACSDDQDSVQQSYEISGQVLNLEGEGVEGVEIHLKDSQDEKSATTGEDGNWTLTDVSQNAEVQMAAEGLPETHTVSSDSSDLDFITAQLPESNVDENELDIIMDQLTSAEFNGRLAGTEGGQKTEEYIKDYFADINNLKSPEELDDKYKQPFSHWLYYPSSEQPAVLEITDADGNLIEELAHLEEFKPFTSFVDVSLDKKIDGAEVHIYDGEIKEDFAGGIVLLPKEVSPAQALEIENKHLRDTDKANYGYQELKDILNQAAENDVQGLIIEQDTASIDKTAVIEPNSNPEEFKGDNPIFFRALSSSFDKLEAAAENNNKIRMEINYNLVEGNAESNNIIGYIEGKTDENLLIGAHFDHLGFDYDEKGEAVYYSGALDNASGTAVLMQLAKSAAEDLGTPEKNIIFIGFGGEEINLKGSLHYAQNPLFDLENTSVINLDMIEEPLNIYNAESLEAPMLQKLSRILTVGSGIENTKINESAPSDNIAFEMEFSDNPGEKENIISLNAGNFEGVIHTLEDTKDKLSMETINKITQGLLTYIYNEAY